MIDFEQWYEQEIGSENKPEYEAAKWAWEYQQKKLDCCREENKAHLEKIDELQARIDDVLEELEIDLQSPDYDDLRYRVGDAVDILKGSKDD